jgi:hypothetical protein
MDTFNIGDLVQVIDSPGLLDREGSYLRYRGLVGLIVDFSVGSDCWVVQFDDGTEIEVPAACLVKE